jgi:hypothetical protein
MYPVDAVVQHYSLTSRSDSMDVVQAQQSSETAARHLLSETAHTKRLGIGLIAGILAQNQVH